MPTSVLATKLFVPARRPNLVARSRLTEQLNAGFDSGHRLTLISAPAGFGKTTLVSDWIDQNTRRRPDTRIAWLSLDDGDNDPTRLLTHLVAALQRCDEGLGADAPTLMGAARPVPVDPPLTDLTTARDPENQINLEYGTVKFPETYVIDGKGKVVRKLVNSQDWMSQCMVSDIQSLL